MKALCLSTSPFSHQVEHLATLSSVLDIPLLLTDPSLYDLTKKYYPFTKVYYKTEVDCSLEFLASHFDLLIVTCKYWAKDLSYTIQHLLNKKMRFCYCPHGNSDKGSLSPQLDLLYGQDLSFIYGNHMKEMLEKRKVLSSLQGTITTGNYRYHYYLKHKKFYDDLIEKEVFSSFKKKQTTILYAPTWKDPENSSSFFEATPLLIDQLPDHYNLLIKLHPNLERDDPAKIYHLIGKYQDKKNVVFLIECPLVYPILSRVDLYLGDFSSVGYDFLKFNKPLFFFNHLKRDPSTDDGLSLFQCGRELSLDKNEKLFEIIEENLINDQKTFQEIRKKTYEYAFEKNVSFEKIKENLFEVVRSSSFLESSKN